MNLVLRNIGKVADARIAIDGLTAIIGDNDMGKSTTGKALYALFRSFSEVEESVFGARVRYVVEGAKLPRAASRSMRFLHPTDFEGNTRPDPKEIERRFEASHLFRWSVGGRSYVSSVAQRQDLQALAMKVCELVEKAKSIPFDALFHDVVTETIGSCFDEQFLPNFDGFSGESIVAVEECERPVLIGWSPERVNLPPVGLPMEDAWFVGTPLVLDAMADRPRVVGGTGMMLDSIHQDLVRRLRRASSGSFVAKRLAESSLAPVMELLNRRVNLNFTQKENGGLGIVLPGMVKPLGAVNLSMGLKVFSVLKLMIESNVLKEGDLLVLDEPENHLHPDYQEVFAKIVVLLQDIFKLRILLTTHSPYFLQALELHARQLCVRNGTSARLRVYQPKIVGEYGRVAFEDISGDTSRMYRKFAQSMRELDLLRTNVDSEERELMHREA